MSAGGGEGPKLHRSGEFLGSGADGEVRLAGGFAEKYFHRRHVYEHEARVLRQLPAHVTLIRVVAEDADRSTLRFRRYCCDLMQRLLSDKEVAAEEVCIGLTTALTQCHRVGVVHRDVKPENVLIDYDGTPVLCDFSKALFAPEPISVHFAGTRGYASPEAIAGRCCTANDVWSAAVVYYCVVERMLPFDSDDEHVGARDDHVVPADKLEFHSSRWCGDFERRLRAQLGQCLRVEPDARPSARCMLTTMRSWNAPLGTLVQSV